jgi:hypothetical protein
MEFELDSISKYLNTINSNFDGTCENLEFLTLLDLYNRSRPALLSIGSKFSLGNFSLPTEMGANSLVIYSGATVRGKKKNIAIKISLGFTHSNSNNLDYVLKLASDFKISPKILHQELVEFGSPDAKIKIVLSTQIIPFSSFKWSSVNQIKQATVSLIEKTLLLHSWGYVHNDLKYENFGMDKNGTVYLFDFDNYSQIKKLKCPLNLSSSVCHPPPALMNDYLEKKLGNRIIDLFSIVSIILGDFYGIKFWQFSKEQFQEKTKAVSNFNRGKIYYWIQHNLAKKFKGYAHEKNPFWYALTNFVHLILKEVATRSRRNFIIRANRLVERMKVSI